MTTILCLRYDQFKEIPLAELQEGDVIHYLGQTLVLLAPVHYQEAVPHLSVEPFDEGAISLMVGDYAKGRDSICRVMDMCMADLHDFPDETSLIGNFQTGSIFSPRLPIAELEVFCQEHMLRYEAFCDANQEKIDNAEAVTLKPWWNTANC